MWHRFRVAKAMGDSWPIREQPAFSNTRLFIVGLVSETSIIPAKAPIQRKNSSRQTDCLEH